MSENKSDIIKRKVSHLSICSDKPIEFQTKTTWFEHVELIHQSMSNVSLEKIETSTTLFKKTLSIPFIIGAITGGTEKSKVINRTLAEVAEYFGAGFSVGSQKAMIESEGLVDTYCVRDVAPNIMLLGNIGISQASRMNVKDVIDMVRAIGADGICVYLNPAMRLFQHDGEGLLENNYSTLSKLVDAFEGRVVVKETGCGISRDTANKLVDLGIDYVDISGAGGTCWPRIENVRSESRMHSELEEWGIPTAASLCDISDLPIKCIASGGVRTGLDFAKAISLGAYIISAALPLLRAYESGGYEKCIEWLESVVESLRMVMFLTDNANLDELRKTDKRILGPLLDWQHQML